MVNGEELIGITEYRDATGEVSHNRCHYNPVRL
jgi:hypothetical protein